MEMACLNGTVNLRSVFGKDATLNHITSSQIRTNAVSLILNDSISSPNNGYISIYTTSNAGTILSNFTLTTVTVSTGLLYTAGNLVLIKGTVMSANDGIYEVSAYNNGTGLLTIRTSPTEFFSLNTFVTTTSFSGTIVRVYCNVLKTSSNGSWETTNTTTSPLVYSSLYSHSNVSFVSSATYTISLTDDLVYVNFEGEVTLTLPTPTSGYNRRKLTIVDIAGSAGRYGIKIVSPATTTKIVGNDSIKLYQPYGSVTLFYSGPNWFIG